MKTPSIVSFVLLAMLGLDLPVASVLASAGASGALLPDQPEGVALWWAGSAAAKIRPSQTAPERSDSALRIRCARNEVEAAQLVLRPAKHLRALRLTCRPLIGTSGADLRSKQIEVLRVGYVDVTHPTDRIATAGLWPDPLLPLTTPVDLEPHQSQAFWIRVAIPEDQPAGVYRGQLRLRAQGWQYNVPLEITVFDFVLPHRMSCTTAFGFSAGEMFRFHRLETEAQQRAVLEKYWANLAAHHISPYNPAPLDPIQVQWPDIEPPETDESQWAGLRVVDNETQGGAGALLIYDDEFDRNVSISYQPMIPIPEQGLRVRAAYRTAVPGHRFLVSLNHFDADRNWLSGRNNDIVLRGSGAWQSIDELVTSFPPEAKYVQLHAFATTWTDAGEQVGLVWFDDISVTDPTTGKEWVRGGDFERDERTEPVVPLDQLKVRFDFEVWDRAMTRAIDHYHFNSFRLSIPGLGGGTFQAIDEPYLLGFGENTPEYPVLFESYARQMEAHLQNKGWLDEAYVYWFDEPSADQYPFVLNGFTKLKETCPGIARMLTEQVEPGLIGGPNIWCGLTSHYDAERAAERRRSGEKFWWYVCTGPKAPYAGLFIDHPAPELRIWLWQTFQRGIDGILIWQSNYWTSRAAYPDPDQPQNPYADPMSWRSGYDTPSGERHPWGNGDGRFIYPPLAAVDGEDHQPVLEGPVDSIRWEHLRDGIEDYEYLTLLRDLLHQHRETLGQESRASIASLLQVPDSISRTLTDFAADGEPIEQHRLRLARAIERLSAAKR